MARRAARTDGNQQQVIDALRKAGATVASLHAVGMGVPDLIVGHRGVNLLVEVKDGSKPAWEAKLNKMQEKWHADWRGQVAVVWSEEDALRLIGAMK